MPANSTFGYHIIKGIARKYLERDGTLLFLTLIFLNNIDDLNETLDPNGMDAEDYLEFLIRTELKIKRLGRERHRNCRCCKESLSEKRPCLRV